MISCATHVSLWQCSLHTAVKTNILMPPGDSDQVRLDSERLDPRTMRCPEREKVCVLLLASNFASFERSKVYLYFHSYLGTTPILLFFRMGWNHQLAYRYNIPWFVRVLYGGAGSLPSTVSVWMMKWWLNKCHLAKPLWHTKDSAISTTYSTKLSQLEMVKSFFSMVQKFIWFICFSSQLQRKEVSTPHKTIAHTRKTQGVKLERTL